MNVTDKVPTIVGRSTTILRGENAFFLQVGVGSLLKIMVDEISVDLLIVDDNNYFLCVADDSISLPTQLQQDSGFIFSEKSGCNNGKICFFLFYFFQFYNWAFAG